MATNPARPQTIVPLQGEAGPLTVFVDRWIYVFMAGLIMGIVLIGFVPTSIAKVQAVAVGLRAPFPPILHVHAVLMGCWITLLLAQTTLMATGRKGMHMQLGIASFVLAPAMVVTGFLLVPVLYEQRLEAIASAPPAVAEQLRTEILPRVTNLLASQLRVGIVFPLLIALALYFRQRNSGTHKRLMILATIVPLTAAIDRITYLPNTLPDSHLAPDLYMLAVASPMILWDLYRQRRLHSAYVIWFALTVPTSIAIHLLWNQPWWLEAGRRILGAG